jgi:hypothetical protein
MRDQKRVPSSSAFSLAPLKRVKGPDGKPLMLSDLPPANTTRWVRRRKAEVVAGVRGGLLSAEEACTRYRLTVEEFLAWDRAFERFGTPGLRAPVRSRKSRTELSNTVTGSTADISLDGI